MQQEENDVLNAADDLYDAAYSLMDTIRNAALRNNMTRMMFSALVTEDVWDGLRRAGIRYRKVRKKDDQNGEETDDQK